MNAWDVETRPNAYDGVVILLNLQSGNEHHGQVAIYAGKNLLNGNLPQSEIQRIYQDVMLPQLANDAIAQGIAAGLDAISQDLLTGPPSSAPPSRATQFARWPLNLIVLCLASGILGFCLWQQRKLVHPAPIVPTLQPPDDLPPALAGALLSKNAPVSSIQAAIMEIAQCGGLVIESDGLHAMQIRLLDNPNVTMPYEQAIWDELSKHANKQQIVPARSLMAINWSKALSMIHEELLARGWLQPDMAEIRLPFYLAGGFSLILLVPVMVVTAWSTESWGCLAAFWLVCVAITAFVMATSLPITTAAGAQEAQQWRNYQAGLRHIADFPDHSIDTEQALVDGTALGAIDALQYRLSRKSASCPLWLQVDRAYMKKQTLFMTWVAYDHCFATATLGSSGYYSRGYYGGMSGGGFSGGGFGGAGAGGSGGGGGF